MDRNMVIFLGIIIPFIGTTLGSAMVFFLKNDIKPKVQKGLLGFASGVMIAASVWSLLLPAIDIAQEQGKITWLPASVGFLLGIIFLLILDSVIPHLHLDGDKPEGVKASLKKSTMLILAVTLHNIPEGMAVGVVFAGILKQNAGIAIAGAFALSIGIAIQNFPEGAIISMPLKARRNIKIKSICIWNTFRNSRTYWCYTYYCTYKFCCTNTSIFTFICSRGNDLCSSRGINTRITIWGT